MKSFLSIRIIIAVILLLFVGVGMAQGSASQNVAWQSPTNGVLLELNQPYPVRATTTSQLPINYYVAHGPAVIADGMVTVTNVGSVVLVAEQVGNESFAPATASRTFNMGEVQLSKLGEWVGFQRGSARAVFVAEDKAYVAMGASGLAIFDVSEPVNPQPLGSCVLTNNNTVVQVAGNHAYVLGGNLKVVDVSDPFNPKHLSTYRTSSTPLNLFVRDHYVYLAIGFNGYEILDVADPAKPVKIAGTPVPAGSSSAAISDVWAEGDLLFLAGGSNGLFIYDISNPATPALLGRRTGVGTVRGVSVVGDKAYLACDQSGLQIVDVSNPAVPSAAVGGWNSPGRSFEIWIDGHIAYLSDEYTLNLVDISNPQAPIPLSSYAIKDQTYSAHAVDGMACVADTAEGLVILDVNNAAAPVKVSGYNTSGVTYDVDVVGTIAYAADGLAGLQILDFTDPNAPVLLGNYNTGGSAVGVKIVGDIAYVADSANGLEIIQIADPTSPYRLGGYKTVGSVLDVEMVGNLAYVAVGSDGLQILNVANPTNIVLLGAYDTPGNVSRVAVAGANAYVIGDIGVVYVIDASTPNTPMLKATITGINVTGLRILRDILYVTGGSFDLRTYALSGNGKLGQYEVVGTTSDVDVVGSYAFISNAQVGVQVINVQQPTSLTHIASYQTMGNAYALKASGDRIYVANQYSGVEVLQWTETKIPQAITFIVTNWLSVVQVGVPVNLTAAVSTGLPITYTVVSGPATITNNQLYATGLGRIVIRAEQVGTAQYAPVSIERTITVIKEPQTITWQTPQVDQPLTIGQSYPLSATSSSGLPVTYRVESGPAVIVDGSVTATNFGAIMLVAEQIGDATHASATSHRGFNRVQIQLEQLGEWPEIQRRPIRGVNVVGNIAYIIADDEGFITMDVSDPANPVQLGQYLAFEDYGDIQVVGDIAWVTCWETGLIAIDISNPSIPVLKASYPISGGVTDLLVEGGYAYVVSPDTGLHIIDISDVSNLYRIGGYDESTSIGRMFLVGGYAYLKNSQNKVSIIDLSDNRNPVKIATYDALVASIIADGNRAYMLGEAPGLRVVDMTNPNLPSSVSSYGQAGYGIDGQLVGGKLYMVTTEGLKIIDVSKVNAPKLVGTFVVKNCTYVQVVGDLAYLVSAGYGLQIVDVSDPANPRRVWGVDVTLSVGDLEVDGDRVLLQTGQNTVAILDVADPQAPFQLSSITNIIGLSDIELSGNLAYFSAGTNGVLVWDFSDPVNPVKVGGHMFSGSVVKLQIVGNLAYALVNITNNNNLEILGIDSGTNFTSLGKLAERMVDFQMIDGFIFAMDGNQGLKVIDVSDPVRPSKASALTFGGARSMKMVDDLLHVVVDPGELSARGLRVIDISNPFFPREVRRHNITQIYGGLQIKNLHALAIDAWRSMHVWDLNNPEKVVFEATALTNQTVVRIQIKEDTIYAANQVSGLTILRLNEGKSNQVVTFELPVSLRMTNSPLTLTASADSGLPVTFSVVSGPASIQGNQLVLNSQGSVVVRAEQIGNEQYFRAFTDRVVDVVKAPQAIDWTSPIHNTLRLPNQKYPLRATSSSGLPVTFSVISGPATVQGRDVVLNDRGTVVMRAEQAGDNNYSYTRVERTFRVTGEPQTLTWNLPLTNTVLELNEPYPMSATASSGLPVTFRVAAGPAMVTNNTVVVTNVGTVRLVAEQVDDEVYEAIAITNTFNASYVTFTPIGSWTNHFRLWVFDVKVVDDKAYLAMGPDGIIILDVSDISAPKQIGRHSMSASTSSLEVVGDYAYIANSWAMQIIDIRTPSTLREVGSYSPGGGSPVEVRVIGDTAYVVVTGGTTGGGLHILDISDRTNPRRIAYYETPRALRVKVIGNYAYLACLENGFQILDVSNPSKPTRVVASTASDRNIYDVLVRDEFLYLADYDKGLEIINVSDPFNPKKVRDYSVTGKTRRLHFSEELLYLAGEGYGVRVVNPNAPGAAPNLINSYNTYPDVHGMDIQGDIAYLACGADGLRLVRTRKGIRQQLEFEMPSVINISSEDTYPLEAEVSTGRAITFSVVSGPASIVGDEIVFHDRGEVLVRAEQVGSQQYIPVSITRKVQAIRDPQTVTWHAPSTNEVLRLNHPYPLQASASSGLPVEFRVRRGPALVTGNTVIVTNTGLVELVAEQDGATSHEPASALATFNRSSFSVSKIGAWPVPQGSHLVNVRVLDNRAYLACGNGGVTILDVSNPASPVFLGSYDTAGFATRVEVVGELLFVADGINGMQILDISNPTAPVSLSVLNILSSASRVRVQDGFAYVSAFASNGGPVFTVIDVRDSRNPKQLGKFNSNSGYDVQVIGDIAYLAAAHGGMQIIDVADPASPILKGTYLHPPSGFVGSLEVRGSIAYTATANLEREIMIVDIADPENPRTIGKHTQSEFSYQLLAYGSRLYSVFAENSLQILDIGAFGTNLIKTINSSIPLQKIWEVEVNGPFIYAACRENGLQILQQHEEMPQTLTFNAAPSVEFTFEPQTLTAVASSGLPVRFSVTSGPATVVSNQMTLTGVGEVVIRVEQPGSIQFLPASLTRTITVTGLPNVGPDLVTPQMTSDALTLQVNTLVGIKYTLQRKEQLGSGEWEEVSTITGNGSVITFTNEIAELPQMFYRVIITP